MKMCDKDGAISEGLSTSAPPHTKRGIGAKNRTKGNQDENFAGKPRKRAHFRRHEHPPPRRSNGISWNKLKPKETKRLHF